MNRRKNQHRSFTCYSVSGTGDSRELGSLLGVIDAAGLDILFLPPHLCLPSSVAWEVDLSSLITLVLCALGQATGSTSRRLEGGRRESPGPVGGCVLP